MSFVEAIIRKRDGTALDRRQVAEFVRGASGGTLPAEQLSAMLMAICCRGMNEDETRWLTEEMLHSGEVWNLAEASPEAVDKHSTGGVGDTVSLVLAPLLAAVGVPVAMMAGRGLGHSQGTLDKMEAIPGFRCDRERGEVVELLDRCGAAIVAQTDTIAPADRVLYALRDITGTVPSLPLIVGSIMSKKLAMGASSLVLDVKWGSGAFRASVPEAVELATALRAVARAMGVAAEALITDMNQPLGPALGTAIEVRAARDVLGGGGGSELREVTLRLAVEAMVLRGSDAGVSRAALEEALTDGRALAAWDRMVEAHGGDPDPDRMAAPRREVPVTAQREGVVSAVAAAELGWIAGIVGAGRRTRDEELAHGGGVLVHARIGDTVERDDALATLLIGDRPVDVVELEQRTRAAFEIGEEPVESPQLILGTVDDLNGA